MKNSYKLLWIIFVTLLIASCAKNIPDGPPLHSVDLRKIPNAKPCALPRSKYGNPHSYVIHGKRYYVLKTEKGYHKRGVASWYGTKFHGALTSSREPYDMLAMTAASPVLPIPSFVRVTNLSNRRSVIVKVNDRGPFVGDRIIDLSYVAAAKLGYADKGTALVEVQTITPTVRTALRKLPPVKSSQFLQLGAFRQFNKAQDLTNRLKAVVKKPVTIHKVKTDNFFIYRVTIGPLWSTAESFRLQQQLKKLGFSVFYPQSQLH